MHAVRPASPDDAGRIARIQVRGWRAAYRGLIPDELLGQMDIHRHRSFWEDEIRQPTGEVFLVEIENAVTGFCHVVPSRDPDGEGAFEIVAIYVDPARWRKGAGRSLCQAAMASVSLKGAKWFTLWVLAGNLPGRRFYESLGFLADGAVKSEMLRGSRLDEVRYRMDLRVGGEVGRLKG